MRTILAGLLIASTAAAVEIDAKAQATQARSVWSDAAKQGDIWTCLQLEAWARERKPAVRLGATLGETGVIGDARLALPGTISHLSDLGDRLVLATPDRAFVVAPDGRPLQPSLRLAPSTWYQVTGHGGLVMGLCARLRKQERVSLDFGSISLADGKQVLRTTMELTATQHWGEELVVADDGSAVGTIVVSEDGVERRRVRNVGIATAKGTRIEAACRDPYGIGRNGDWLLARGYGDEGQLLIRNGKRTPILAGAAGPGVAAYVTKDRAMLLLRDGREVQLAGTPAIGSEPGVASVGGWLVLGSGHGAQVVSDGDLLGENAGATVEQPSTLALWRWADLLTDPAAKPQQTMPGTLSPAAAHPAALWVWQDKALDLVDLAGDVPVRTRYLDAPGRISWASSDMHCLRLDLRDPGRMALYGPDKLELWSGEAHDVQVKRRDLALTEHRDEGGRTTRRLQWLSSDPAKRRSVVLALPPEADRCQVSVSAPDLVLGRGPQRAWWSAGFDGKALASGDGDAGPAMPDCPEWNWYAPTGRFYREGGRIHEKASGPPADPMQRLQLIDAWRVGSSTMLLQGDGRVLISGRKRGEWLELGQAEGAQRFGLRGTTPVLVRDEARVVASMAPGPKLLPDNAGGALELPNGGPWRLMDNGRFTPPRGRQLQWDGERTGLYEARLRSPEGSGLFVITASVLLELDPDVARFFGK